MNKSIVIDSSKLTVNKEELNKVVEDLSKCMIKPSIYANQSCKISFFEWSDYEREPLIFNDFEEFLIFMGKCGIEVSTEHRIKLCNQSTTYGGVFAICKPNSSELLVEATKWGIEYEMKKLKKNTSSNTVTSSSVSPQCVNPVYYPMRCGYWDDEYDCWE